MEEAIPCFRTADRLLVVGTSLAVTPAASLIHFIPDSCPVFLVDPDMDYLPPIHNLRYIAMKAGEGVPMLAKQWLDEE
jgi:NAD-dependent deacetylase